jgi:hypothetical protein
MNSGRGTTHEGGEPRTDHWALQHASAVVRRGCRTGAWRGAGFERHGARVGLGKVRGLGRRVASGGAALAQTPRRCGACGRDVAAQSAVWHWLTRFCFDVPLFEHVKLQNFK